MDELERKLAEKGIDYTTEDAQKFLEIIKRRKWNIEPFLGMLYKLPAILKNERELAKGRWKGKPSNYGRQRKRIRN